MPNLPYTRDIPHATHNPSSDQPIMEENNNSNDTLWAVDHFGFNDNNGGFHKQVHLKNETAPGISTVDGVLYANVNPANSWPFWQNSLGSFPIITPPTATVNDGTAYIPGGIILKWGIVASTSSQNTVTFSPAFPNNLFNITFGMIITNGSTTNHAGQVYVKALTATAAGFTWRQSDLSADAAGFFWSAIGN